MRRRSSGAKLRRMKTAYVPPSPTRARRQGAAVLALVCLLGTSSAWAQWQWRDGSGRRIFSDTPPPSTVPDKDILARPNGPRPTTATPAGSAGTEPSAAPPATAAKPAPAGADTELTQRKQQLEKAEADKRKADEKAAAAQAEKVRATNCENARKNKVTIESGLRISVTNSRGEAEFLDEAGRAAQLRQANQTIRDSCR